MKSFRILLCVLAILLIGVAIYLGIERRPRERYLFRGKEIFQIEITAKDTLCVFEKKNDGWYLVKPIEYPVDSANFAIMMKGIKELRIGEVVSKRKERQEEFELTAKGVKVKVKWKRGEKEFVIGKRSADFTYSYLMLPPGEEIYLSEGLSKYLVDRRVDDWRCKRIVRIDTQRVEKITVGEKEVIRKDTLWFVGSDTVPTTKIRGLLNLLSNFKADGFWKEGEFEEKLRITIRYKEGEEEVILVGEEKDNKYPLKLEGKEPIFYVYSWKIKRFKELN
jgi:hypothetical protein